MRRLDRIRRGGSYQVSQIEIGKGDFR